MRDKTSRRQQASQGVAGGGVVCPDAETVRPGFVRPGWRWVAGILVNGAVMAVMVGALNYSII